MKRSIILVSEEAEWINTATVNVFSDSILCQGEASDPRTANAAWKKEIEWYKKNSQNMRSIQCEPEEVGGQIIFMSMFDDIVW